jgi:hypothetical protein
MEDKTQILYQKLYDNGLYTKTYDDFKNQWAVNPEKIQELHSVLSKEGHYTKTLDEFNLQYFPVKKKVSSEDGGLPSFDIPSKIGEEVSKIPFEEYPTPPSPSGSTEPPQVSPLRSSLDSLTTEVKGMAKTEADLLQKKYQALIDQNPNKTKELQGEYSNELDSLNARVSNSLQQKATEIISSYENPSGTIMGALLADDKTFKPTLRNYLKLRNVTPKMLGLSSGQNLDRDLRDGDVATYDDLLEFKGLYQKPQASNLFWGTVKAYNAGKAKVDSGILQTILIGT